MLNRSVLLVAEYTTWHQITVTKSQAMQLFMCNEVVVRVSKIVKQWDFEAEDAETLDTMSKALKGDKLLTEVVPVLKEAGIPAEAIQGKDAMYHARFVIFEKSEARTS